MEIEQLKLILETLQGVGHEAGNLAVLYLWLQFAGGALTNLSIMGACVGIAYFVYKGIVMGTGHEALEQFVCEMRNQLGTGTRGTLTTEERDRTMTALRKLVDEHKEQA